MNSVLYIACRQPGALLLAETGATPGRLEPGVGSDRSVNRADALAGERAMPARFVAFRGRGRQRPCRGGRVEQWAGLVRRRDAGGGSTLGGDGRVYRAQAGAGREGLEPGSVAGRLFHFHGLQQAARLQRTGSQAQ